MPASTSSISFATSNEGKVREARMILKPFRIEVEAFDGKGVEMQCDTVEEVASYSAEEAAHRYGKALIVEDAGLFVDALDGFPGPYSSFVFKSIGIPGLLVLLKGKGSRSASFRSAVAYCEPGAQPHIFSGRVDGSISQSPTGENGFGFDPVFLPGRTSRSMGELTIEEKCQLSHRGQAMRRFAAWYAMRMDAPPRK